MALGDPFGTTAELVYKGKSALGERIGNAAQSIAGAIAVNQQRTLIRNQGQQLLSKFGLLKSDGSVDQEKAKDLGVEMSSDGSVTIKPQHQLPTLAQQIQDLEVFSKWKESHPEAKDYNIMGGVKGTILKPQTNIKREEMEEQFYQKEWDKIVKETSPATASSRSTYGMASNANLRADRALSTLNQPFLTAQDSGNVQADLAAIYQGGSATEYGMSHQQYNTLQTTVAKAIQYWTGHPTKALPNDIKSRLKDVLNGLKKVNNQYIKQHFNFIEKAQPKVIGRYKDEWEDMKNQYLPERKYSQKDLEYTANKRGITVEEVKRRLGI